MWGDDAHIKKLKDAAANDWPDDWPDDKKTKKGYTQPDDAALKAIDKANGKLAKQQVRHEKRQRKANRQANIANLKADAWQVKQDARALKDERAAQRALLKAERNRAKEARRLADAEARWLKEAVTAAKKDGNAHSAYIEPTCYAPDALPSGGGCSATMWLLLIIAAALVALYFCLCNCG